MKKQSARRVAIALAATFALSAWFGVAESEAREGPLYKHSKSAKMTRKLFRGVGNTLFCWAEIPKSVFRKSYSTDIFTGVFYGIGEGIENGGKRLGYGVWETVTFYSPGQREYRPYMEPEFVLMDVVE